MFFGGVTRASPPWAGPGWTLLGAAPNWILFGNGRGWSESVGRVCAFPFVLAIGLSVAACQTPAPAPPPPAILEAFVEEEFVAPPTRPERTDQPAYFRLPGTPDNVTPVRVAMLLPFTSPQAEIRAVADALERAAELALFDAQNSTILLMPRDDGGSPERAAAAAAQAISEDGAEIILGPLFAQSVTAVAPVAREHGVPVIAFSSNRAVGGDGVYLLSFQLETEVQRIVSYATRMGHTGFAALVPRDAYGELVSEAFRASVTAEGARITALESYPPQPELVGEPVARVAASFPDAILIAQGGVLLQAIAPALALSGADNRTVKFLGTGLWNDPAVAREPMLINGWFPAPSPEAWADFSSRFQEAYGSAPPRIASLGYDAMALVALLADGVPYHRYTAAALTDPDGFVGVDGIFRFRSDGSADRGLAVLQVGLDGFTVVDPAPSTFQIPGF